MKLRVHIINLSTVPAKPWYDDMDEFGF
jgi:hypothetical protein